MAREKKKPKIILLDRWERTLKELTLEESGKIFRAIYAYWLRGEEPSFDDRATRIFWNDIAEWLNECRAHYIEVSEARAVARENKNKQKITNESTESNDNKCEQLLTNAHKAKANAKAKANTKAKANAKAKYDDDDDHDDDGRDQEKEINNNNKLLYDDQENKNGIGLDIADFFTENAKAKKILNHYRKKIGNFRSPEEYAQLKQLIISYNEAGYILCCIDFMKNEGGKSVKYLEKICEGHYEEYEKSLADP